MNSELRKRIEKVADLKSNCSGILLYNHDTFLNPNFTWLTDISVNGWLWMPFSGKPKLFVHKMYPEAKQSWIKPTFISSHEEIFKAVKGRRAGIDLFHMSAEVCKKLQSKLKTKDISEQLESARAVKTPYEINQISKACKITEKILQSVKITPSITESRLRADLDWEIANRGLEPSFPTIVATGKNIAVPHHVPDSTKLSKPTLIDIGVRYKNYCSDITRTFGSKYQQIINKVFEAVEPLLAPGASCAAINNAACKALGKHAKHFITGLGHGVGIAIHEDPNLTAKSNDVLQIGNVFTVEPGIYVPNGIRHENVYVITKNGAKNLSNF